MKKIVLSIYTLLMISAITVGQEKKSPVSLKLKGFVNYEMIYDSRQVVTARDGDVLLYPAAVSEDPNGKDLNAVSQFNALAITSRLQGLISGPDALGAKTSGMISADFFGTTNEKVGIVRLRQAYLKLKWDKSELLLGKAWHPLFITEVFPKVLSFGAAIPFYPLSRAPQVSYTVKGGRFEWTGALAAQQDFASAGPNGRTPSYLMNTGMPEVDSRLVYRGEKLLLGVGAGFWKLKPRLVSATGYQTEETVNGMMINAFGKLSLKGATIRGGYLYGKNLSHLFMFGGYGVSEVSDDEQQIESYTPTAASSLWADIEGGKGKVTWGFFAGYTKNLGADTDITGPVYAVGSTIDNYMRFSPRLAYTTGKVKIGVEGIYHVAAYGTPDAQYKVTDTYDVDAFRFITSVAYFF
ncbi:hypothetical protein DMA11_18705 [Marinilabiliaceae bacterium JC017]|nr:hypothetical protein DMA11_18705 [Marinilabiliaceae bacterium JC017]